MGKVWKPVSGNMYGNLEMTPEGRIYVAYYNGIDQLSTMDSECPADLRLCRQVPDAASVPVEVAETLREALAVWSVNVHMDAACGDVTAAEAKECDRLYASAAAWLDQQQKGGG